MLPLTGGAGERRARFELLSGIGALVLGAGIALICERVLAPLAVPLLLLGIIVHGWAMWAKHRLDAAGSGEMPQWTMWAYRICWILIVGLGIYMLYRF